MSVQSVQASIARRSRKRNGKLVKSRTWYLRFRRPGDVRWSKWVNLGVSDKQVAEEKRSQFIRDTEREIAGIRPSRLLREGITGPLLTFLDGYIAFKKTAGRDSMYVYNIERHVRKLARECGWNTPRDVAAGAFEEWRARQSLDAKTLDDYLADASLFFEWLRREKGCIESNPLANVERLSRKRHDSPHRALAPDEVNRLLNLESPYYPVYHVALVTGLRRKELRQLLWMDLHLDDEKPYIEAPGSITKNGERATLDLPLDVATMLAGLKPASAKCGDRVFARIPSMKVFRKDLECAGIDHEPDARGRKVVLHSLRHTLNTNMGRKGVPLAVAMRVMRHSDPKLTMRRYMDRAQLPTREAVIGLEYPKARVGTHKRTTDTVTACQGKSEEVTSGGNENRSEPRENAGIKEVESPAVTSGRDKSKNWGTRIRT